MKNKLVHNLSLKIMAILFSVILWMIAVDINDPVEKKTFSNVQVQLINTSSITGQGKTYKVINNTDTVKVTVLAKKTVLASITENDITAQADVSMLSYTNTVPIDLVVDKYVDNRVESITTDKESVQLEIEDVKKKQLRIEVLQNGSLPDGYVTGKITTETNTMSISGPESAVSPVTRAVVEITLDSATANIDMVAPIRLLDEEGREVASADIMKSIDSVKVTVPVLPTKEVPVVFHMSGAPADGYVATGNIAVSPEKVTIAGKETVLNEIASIEIPDTELNVEDATGDVSRTVNIGNFLSADVMLADKAFDGLVTATAEILPIRRKAIAFGGELVQLVNVPEGWSVEVAEDQHLRLTLSGLQQYLEEIEITTVVPHIDVSALQDENGSLQEGELEAEVSFLIPDHVEQADSVTVKLLISQLQETE